jgi:hypothetical protein
LSYCPLILSFYPLQVLFGARSLTLHECHRSFNFLHHTIPNLMVSKSSNKGLLQFHINHFNKNTPNIMIIKTSNSSTPIGCFGRFKEKGGWDTYASLILPTFLNLSPFVQKSCLLKKIMCWVTIRGFSIYGGVEDLN